MSNFFQRTLFGSLGVAITAALLYFSTIPLGFALCVAVLISIQVLAQLEFYSLVDAKGIHTLKWIGIAFTTLTLFAVSMHFWSLFVALPPLALLSAFIYFLRYPGSPVTSISTTVFGAVYTLLPLLSALLLLVASPIYLALPLVSTKLGDIVAYICGKSFGRTPLAKIVSPKKTWEGAIGGVIGATLGALLFFGLGFSIVELLFLGVTIGILGQLGDLSESLLKREVNVKDSAALPGLGGILDVLDSLAFTLPFMFIYLMRLGL